MAERRSLVEGLKQTPALDPEVERDFVFQNKPTKPKEPAKEAAPSRSSVSRVPFSTRIDGDIAAALKRASLQRQLENIEPNAIGDILEAALEPWLRSNGHLP